MNAHELRVLLISTRDRAGGAEKVAVDLLHAYRDRGHEAKLVVGFKHGQDPNVLTIPNGRIPARWSSYWWRLHEAFQPYYGTFFGSRRLGRLLHFLAEPMWLIDRYRGVEDFRYPGTWRILDELAFSPDVIHCHNLHGNYFDLRALSLFSRVAPVVLTLQDEWTLTGHCAYTLGCERWKHGCGQCPDLMIYPAIRRDSTAHNWRRKQEIYSRCRLRVVTPSHWLMERVEQSMLAPFIASRHIVRNGIHTSIFRPGDRLAARQRVGLDPSAFILAFAANGIRKNRFKDFPTMRQAVAELAKQPCDRPLLFLGVGDASPDEQIGRARFKFIPYQTDPHRLADVCLM